MARHAPSPPPNIAYMEDAEGSDDEPPSGAERQYAKSTAPSSPVKKEKSNTSRSRKESRRARSPSPVDLDDVRPPPRRPSKMKSKDEKRRSRTDPVVLNPKRPPPQTVKTTPPPRRSDEASYYGISSQTVAAASSRPRAHTRPQSYYGQSSQSTRQHRPPMSASAYYYQPPPSSQFPTPSFSPHPWEAGPHSIGRPMPPHGPMMPPAGTEHFINRESNRDLAARFQRPQSAHGFQQYSSSPYEPPQLQEKALVRRSSVSRKTSKEHDDRRRMPPPARPATARPERVSYRPPPSTIRKSVGFQDDDYSSESDTNQSVDPHDDVQYGSGSVAIPYRPRRQSIGTESYFDGYDVEPASRSRRTSSYNFEDKIQNAANYQEIVGSSSSLTADALRRVKNGGSSHSTRSSASRDESDWKHSATTRTTRSSSGDDDITIKLPSGAVVEVGNTKIHVREGGDMSLGRSGTTRGGSDRTNSIYSDDRKTRADRSIATRTRAGSQAGSYPRALHAPPPPTYNEYSPFGLPYDKIGQPYDSNGQYYDGNGQPYI